MKRILIAGALLLLPGVAMASPWTGTQIGADPQATPTLRHDYTYFNCSTGGAGSLLVGAVAAGLLVRRRK